MIGVLGSATAEVMAEQALGVPLIRVGVQDTFGQVGTPSFLQQAYRLTADDLVTIVKQAL